MSYDGCAIAAAAVYANCALVLAYLNPAAAEYSRFPQAAPSFAGFIFQQVGSVFRDIGHDSPGL